MYKDVCVTKLHNGVCMPAMGFGTWQLAGTDETTDLVMKAMNNGYFLIDTADCYQNQAAIGKALKNWDPMHRKLTQPLKNPPTGFELMSMEDFEKNFEMPHGKTMDNRKIFITGKIFTPDFMNNDRMMASVNRFEKQVGRSADLMLLHWPAGHTEWSSEDEMKNSENPQMRIRCWRFLEDLYRAKRVRAIGVANYMYPHLKTLMDDIKSRHDGIMPMVNQIERSPHVPVDPKLEDLCRQENIVMTAYSVLGSSNKMTLKHPHMLEMLKIVKEKNPAVNSVNKLALRWALQKGYCVIPRTTKEEHLKDNLKCLDCHLDDEIMKGIDMCKPMPRACPDPHEIA